MPQSDAAVQTVPSERTHVESRGELAPVIPRGQPLVLCATALVASWLMWGVADSGFDRYHLPKELGLTLAALLCALLWLRGSSHFAWDRCDQLALASLSISALSGLLATTPSLSLRSCSLELAVTVLFLTGRSLTERSRARLLTSIVLGATGVALVALAESYGLIVTLSRAGRIPGATLGQRNMVAHLLALALPCAWWLGRSERRHDRMLGALASSCLAGVLLLTRSRAGWLGALAALLAFSLLTASQLRTAGLRNQHAQRLPRIASVAGLLVVLLVPTRLAWSSSTPYADTLTHLLDSEKGSGAGRLAQYRASLALVPLHPLLGAGPGNWMVEYPRVAPTDELARRGHGFLHTGRLINSDWVALLCERGLLGGLCALALALALARTARESPALPLAAGAAAALLVVGSFDAVLQVPATAALSALLFALAIPRAPTLRPPGKFPRLLVGALCLSLVWTGWVATQRLLGLHARTRPEGGFAAMERAVKYNGADLFARFSLAEAYALNGDCEHARPHLTALAHLLPYHHAVRELGCVDEGAD